MGASSWSEWTQSEPYCPPPRVRHLGPKEPGVVPRRLVHQRGNPFCLHALHDALDGARAEVVAAALHGETVHPHDRPPHALVDQVHHPLDDLVGDEDFPREIRIHLAPIGLSGTPSTTNMHNEVGKEHNDDRTLP